MRRLIFINRYFAPDYSATSQILSDLAFHLAGSGREVHVVASTQIYGDPKASLPDSEIIRSVHVHRVPSTQFGRAALLGRAVDYLSFYKSVGRCLRQIARQKDILIAKTDPPLISLVAMPAARRIGAKLVNWLQDIYPEIAVELGVPLVRGPVASSLAAARNRCLQVADATVVVGHLMGQRVRSFGADPARIHVIPNWCNDEEIKPLEPADNPLRQAWGLQNKFVVGYSGNLGRAHEFATVLEAAKRMRDDPRVLFLMIGGGKQFEELAGTVKQNRLDDKFRFLPYQDRKLLGYSLDVPDVHWISLKPSLEGLIFPSKIYGIAAAAKPVIAIAAKHGELSRLVHEHGCGVVIEPGDANALVGTLSRLSRDLAGLAEMGARARQMLNARFTRQNALERWDQLIDQLETNDPPRGADE